MSGSIINLIESRLHVRTKSEEFSQHRDFVKLFLNIHREHHTKVGDKEQELDDGWFNKVDQEIFAFGT